MNLEGVRRILGLREENKRLRNQVDRLRRLLGEAQARVTGRPVPGSGVVHSVRIRERRNLPDVPRKGPFG